MSYSNVAFCQHAYEGKTGLIKQQLASDKSLVNKADQDGRTALHWAASAGKSDIVQLLISHDCKVSARYMWSVSNNYL